ncbi:MAG TPA: sigma-70 family RNA polymerase sigma factor [Ktedonobacteraceae bacterium]|nr:sigma-70 family RNA polymerase sigma factor [Ktedonobacteraceae bacterium]
MAELVREDEVQLIARSQLGDVDAFNQLVLYYQQSTYGVIFRMLGDRDAAADVTQDVFIAAFRGIQSFRGGSSFRAWLMRIASNAACDYWRRTQRHPTESLDIDADDDDGHTASILNSAVAMGQEVNPEEYLLNRELQELIQRGLQELPLDQRVAVVLCDIQGLSYEEIAATTQATLGTVRSRIARGRARLRSYLYKHRELLPRGYRLSTDRE